MDPKTLHKTNDYLWEIPRQGEMRVSGRIFASEKLIREMDEKVREHGEDYMDTQMPWELPNDNKIPEDELARDYAIQSQCYACTEFNYEWFCNDLDEPYTTFGETP